MYFFYYPDFSSCILEIMDSKMKLGEGSYGCVIKGTLGYSTNSTNNTILMNANGEVTKLFVYEKDFKKEIRNTNIANKLDINTSLIIHSTTIYDKMDIDNILNDNRNKEIFNKISLCHDLMTNLRTLNNIYQITFSNQGVDIEILDTIINNFNNVLLIKLFYNLFNSLSIYRKEKFNHYDIKENNILYLPTQKKLVFIDYGMSCFDAEIEVFDFMKYLVTPNLNEMRLYKPPEIIAYSIINKYKNNIKDPKNKKYCFDEFKKRYDYNITYDEINYKHFLIRNLYNSEEKMQEELERVFDEIYTDFFQKNDFNIDWIKERFTQLDTYCLSWVLLVLIRKYNYIQIPNENDKQFVLSFCKEILVNAIQIDHKKRLNIHDLVEKYIKFVNK